MKVHHRRHTHIIQILEVSVRERHWTVQVRHCERIKAVHGHGHGIGVECSRKRGIEGARTSEEELLEEYTTGYREAVGILVCILKSRKNLFERPAPLLEGLKKIGISMSRPSGWLFSSSSGDTAEAVLLVWTEANLKVCTDTHAQK